MARSRRSPVRRPWSNRTRETVAFYLFMLPWIVGILALYAVPLVASVVLSFTNWDLFQPPQWVGLRNYASLLTGEGSNFWLALRNTAYYAAILVPVNLALSIAFAMLLNQPIVLRRWFRTAFYLPSTIPIVAVVMLWSWLLAPSGIVNSLLSVVGVDGPAWLVDPDRVKDGLIIMGVWQLGGGVVLFLAALQGIPRYLYEATTIDGAGPWRQFRSITVPMLSPIILFNLINGIIGALQVFTQVYVVTQGHNAGALMMVPFLYENAFEFNKMGYASAIAVLLFVMIMLLTLVILRWSRRWVHYEGEVS
ncbi:sugar ABC transporter permease [Asanoa sp. NPDC050611]|uniref:carbohydrate ABC transporter permease n=1 Tax=Asanoa sp. NPDC050611 TaxID=3157098 RepID=UPI0033D054A3